MNIILLSAANSRLNKDYSISHAIFHAYDEGISITISNHWNGENKKISVFFSRILISVDKLEMEKSRNGFGKIRSIRHNHLARRGSFCSSRFNPCQDRFQGRYSIITSIRDGKWTGWRWTMPKRWIIFLCVCCNKSTLFF